MPPGLIPPHKQCVLIFLDRVYGLDTQEMFFRLVENSFLPDLRGATMMDAVRKFGFHTQLKNIHHSQIPILS